MLTNPCSNYAKEQSHIWFPECTFSSLLKRGMIFVYLPLFATSSTVPVFSKFTLGGFSIPASSSFMWEMVHLDPETNTFPTASEALISSGNSIMNIPSLKISLLHGEDLN